MSLVDLLRQRGERLAFAARVMRGTGLAGALRLRGAVPFARDARRVRVGPHLAVMLHARMSPHKEALVDCGASGPPRRWTWATLDRACNHLAHALAARGGAGRPIACLLGNRAEYVIAQQALARIGATAVQIGTRSKPAEIAYILDNAEPHVALIGAEHVEAFAAAQQLAATAVAARVIVCGDAGTLPAAWTRWDDALAEAPDDAPPAVGPHDGGGVIVYTSGTTGKPKGAARNFKQTGIEAVADLMLQVGVHHDDRHLVTCPLYHSAAPAFVAVLMSIGATVVLMEHFEPEAALAIVERERITCTLVVPTMLVRLIALPDDVRRRYDTSPLRWVMSAAAPLATETARRFMDRFGPILWNFYGATETGVVTLAGPDDHLRRPGTVGRLLRGNEVRLYREGGGEVAPGEVGELYAKNSMRIVGYHKDPDATARSQRDGFFSVGDLARVDADGFYYLESRKHDMVISGGVNIYPREIEDHLMTHPAVQDVAVVGVPDEEWGEALRAFVVVRAGCTLTAAEVADHCRAALADYKRPRQVVFIDELPRNPTGKVLKRELRERRT